MEKNLKYSLEENNLNSEVSYEDILDKVNEESENCTNSVLENDWTSYGMEDVYLDQYLSLELDYNENYKKKELERIMDYYGLSKRKKRKDEIIQDLIIFENAEENQEIVNRRKTLWYYMEEINNDNYLSKFLILD